MNFNDLSKRSLDELMNQLYKKEFKLETADNAAKIVHETSHYFDNLATLSGQNLLVKTYDALSELIPPSSKEYFPFIEDFFDTFHSWNMRDFTEIRDVYTQPIIENWSFRWEFQNHVDISDNELSFSSMSANFKYLDNTVAKIPFSMEALWETNAMWAETMYRIYAVTLSKNDDAKVVEAHRIQQNYQDYVYNPQLLVYSIAAHFVSSFLQTGDYIRTFMISKALTSIALNLPFEYYDKIKKPSGYIFSGTTGEFLENKKSIDPCMIYLVLLENIYESRADIIEDGLFVDFEKVLEINDLPNIEKLNAEILKEMQKVKLVQKSAAFQEAFDSQMENGISIFKRYGIEGGVNIMPAFLVKIANESLSCVFQEDMEETDAYLKYDLGKNLEKLMTKILKVSKDSSNTIKN
ncbi:hypothetical protein V6B14_22450 (plasmid) [Sporosarcina psychrophila]|uniref:hypothetical protein n=1 Tax=Sporosarcina psychrophila TaxID=1476 RepID=UPI0030CCC6AE